MQSTLSWLNNLSLEDCRRAHEVLASDTVDYYNSPVGASLDDLAEWVCVDSDNEFADGQFWISWLRCHRKTGEDYPRHQPKLSSDRPGSGSQVTRLREKLSQDGWRSFNELALRTPGRQPKIPAHHLALRAKAGERLPSNLGSGSSVSHLCDNKNCINPEHMEVAEEHSANLRRQRCPGVTVIEFGQRVLQVQSCPHGNGLTHLSRLNNSCRRIHVVRLDERVAERMQQIGI